MKTLIIDDSSKILLTTHLDSTLSKKVYDFLSSCNASDGCTYDLFIENDWNDPKELICFYIYVINDHIASFLSLFCPDHTNITLYPLTAPNHRNQGCFHALYTLALEEIHSKLLPQVQLEVHLNQTTNHSDPHTATINILHHYNFEETSTEYVLKYVLSSTHPSTQYPVKQSSLEVEFEENEYGNEFSLWSEDLYIGGCLCSFDNTSHHATIYQYGIVDEFQGKGYGKNGLILILSALYDLGYNTVLLQVSGQNKKALNLYIGLGFSIVEETLILTQSNKEIFG